MYGVSNTAQTATIDHITIHGSMRNSFTEATTTTAGVNLGWRLNSTNYWGVEKSLTQEYSDYSTQWNVNSETGVAWNRLSINDMEIGVRYWSGTGEPDVNQIYLEIWFGD